MNELKIQLDESLNTTLVRQLVGAIQKSIQMGQFVAGDLLPSVNQLSNHASVSRDTVFKAYRELKKAGIIESIPAKGYRVLSSVQKVFVFLDSFSIFKDILYHSFMENLPESYHVDLAFHHYNEPVFDTVLLSSIGKYNRYVVMNINGEKISKTLKKFDPGKLLLLDWGITSDEPYSYVMQDFGKAIYESLGEARYKISKYLGIVLYIPDNSKHPVISKDYIVQFCRDNLIDFKIITELNTEELKKDRLFFTFHEKDLFQLLRMCKEQNFSPGEDIGVLSYNDSPVLELIGNGISAITTDFAEMGRQAAIFVKTKSPVKIIVPTKFINRGSL